MTRSTLMPTGDETRTRAIALSVARNHPCDHPHDDTGMTRRAAMLGATIAATLLLGLSMSPAFGQSAPVQDGAPNVPEFTPAFPAQTEAPQQDSPFAIATSEIAGGLVQPWAVAVLPGDAGYLVTERPGRLRHIARDGTVSDPLGNTPEVVAQQQGGLLDVALAPDFADSRIIYLTYAAPMEDGMSATAAARARLSDDMTALEDLTEIWVQSPPSPTPMHYGSRVVPTDDGHVFITTGDHFTLAERDLAQTLVATYGKVIRVRTDGSVPDDNPFLETPAADPSIWTYGHRNIQGAAIRPETGALWAIEHGPAGGDELNLIESGANYGWPAVSYGERYSGAPIGTGSERHEPEFAEPRYYWDPVIAPGGMVFYDGSMFPEWQGDAMIAGLVAQSVVRLELSDDTVTAEERLVDGYARVRDVAVDTDGAVLFVTGQNDGVLARIYRD